MLVIIKSAPDTPEGKKGVRLACDMHADIVLLQNGIYFIKKDQLEDLGFVRTAYVLEDDRRLRGLTDDDAYRKNIKNIDYDGLVDLMDGSDKVIGMF